MEKKLKINIAEEFYHRLVNRDKLQGDGKNTAEDFRMKYLGKIDSQEWWDDPTSTLEIDFKDVETLGPSWANEAFAYFTKYDVNPKKFFKKVDFKNITDVKRSIIKTEIETGYSR